MKKVLSVLISVMMIASALSLLSVVSLAENSNVPDSTLTIATNTDASNVETSKIEFIKEEEKEEKEDDLDVFLNTISLDLAKDDVETQEEHTADLDDIFAIFNKVEETHS